MNAKKETFPTRHLRAAPWLPTSARASARLPLGGRTGSGRGVIDTGSMETAGIAAGAGEGTELREDGRWACSGRVSPPGASAGPASPPSPCPPHQPFPTFSVATFPAQIQFCQATAAGRLPPPSATCGPWEGGTTTGFEKAGGGWGGGTGPNNSLPLLPAGLRVAPAAGTVRGGLRPGCRRGAASGLGSAWRGAGPTRGTGTHLHPLPHPHPPQPGQAPSCWASETRFHMGTYPLPRSVAQRVSIHL